MGPGARQLAVVAARKGAHGAALGHLADAAATVPADAPRDLALAIHAQLGHTGLMQVSTLITQGAPKSKARTPLAHLETALALAESLGDANAKARILVDLGNARALLGEDDTAMALFDQATALAETQGEMRQTMVLRRKPAG